MYCKFTEYHVTRYFQKRLTTLNTCLYSYILEFIEIDRVNSNIYLALRRGYRLKELTPIFILHGIEDTGIYRVNSNIYLHGIEDTGI